jgi:hypothetical protein
MTIIAFKDGVIAADGLVTSGWIRVGWEEKLWWQGGSVVGACGLSEDILRFKVWMADRRPEQRPRLSDDFCGVEITADRLALKWERGLLPLRQQPAGMVAIGSGQEIALGAMAAGASAERAVAIACDLHVTCGPPISVIRVW